MTNKRKNWVEKLFARTPSRRSPQSEQYNSARRKLRLETLEDRSLLTAIGVSTIDSIAAEGVGSDYGSWEITRSGGQNNLTCSVYFRLTGTASCGSDYSLYTADGNSISTSSYYDPDTQQYYPAAHVWIEPNASSVTIQLRPTNDAEKEQAETATIELISYNCYQESGPASGSASITINDNDSWTASVATTDGTAKEAPPSSSNFGMYAITRAGETDTTHQLYVRFQMTGTSTPSDYTLYTSSGTSISISSQWDQTTQTYIYTGGVYIPHGSFSTTVELRPNNDAEKELSETAIMTLLPSTTEYGYGAYGVTGSG
ncbi:MAG: hypothetical protein PHO46_08510, partial [Thermoguttaceae bacterium]|nr:hypothetical protein [Thermoguttaceae bacterium]